MEGVIYNICFQLKSSFVYVSSIDNKIRFGVMISVAIKINV